jgi:hypothetical protein
MKTLIVTVLLSSALAAGCAQGYYPEAPSPFATYSIAPAGGISPSFYDNNPSLSHWYEPPHWMPDAD